MTLSSTSSCLPFLSSGISHMPTPCPVSTMLTWSRHNREASTTESPNPVLPNLSPGPQETQGFDCHHLSHRGRSLVVKDWAMGSWIIPAPVPKPQVLCQRVTAWIALEGQRNLQRGIWENPAPSAEAAEPPVGIVSTFLFPESAMPAEAAKWETWGTLN